jgi:hypothetical protein
LLTYFIGIGIDQVLTEVDQVGWELINLSGDGSAEGGWMYVFKRKVQMTLGMLHFCSLLLSFDATVKHCVFMCLSKFRRLTFGDLEEIDTPSTYASNEAGSSSDSPRIPPVNVSSATPKHSEDPPTSSSAGVLLLREDRRITRKHSGSF